MKVRIKKRPISIMNWYEIPKKYHNMTGIVERRINCRGAWVRFGNEVVFAPMFILEEIK